MDRTWNPHEQVKTREVTVVLGASIIDHDEMREALKDVVLGENVIIAAKSGYGCDQAIELLEKARTELNKIHQETGVIQVIVRIVVALCDFEKQRNMELMTKTKVVDAIEKMTKHIMHMVDHKDILFVWVAIMSKPRAGYEFLNELVIPWINVEARNKLEKLDWGVMPLSLTDIWTAKQRWYEFFGDNVPRKWVMNA